MTNFSARQAKRLRTISLLMIASQLMLLVFVGEWNRVQYRQDKQRLQEDVKAVYAAAERQLSDSLLDFSVATVLAASDTIPAETKVNIQVTHNAPADTVVQMPHGMHAMAIRSNGTNAVNQDMPAAAASPDSTYIVHDGSELPEQMRKILRVAFVQVAGNAFVNGTPVISDTLLREKFAQGLKPKWPALAVHLYPQQPAGDTAFLFRRDELPFETDTVTKAHPRGLQVTGQGIYLFRSLLPQLIFSGVLLLLTGLAFWLAYRTLKRQARFGAQKDSFIDNISHELKTPVSTTKVALEALSNYQGLEDPVRARKYLQMATWEIDRLETMIDRVMQTLQTENGDLQLNKEPVNLYQLVNEITGILQPMLTARDVTVQWHEHDANLTIPADKPHLLSTLYNLVENAVKYGGHHISFTLQTRDGYALLSIADDGPGIDVAYRKKVFEKFFRVPQGNVHTVKGHGLGLSYAQYIAEAHGGHISLESTPGKGSIFTVSLPLTDTQHGA